MNIKCHALENLKAYRSELATAIQNYLVACAELRSACSQIQHQSRTRRELEPVLLAVEAELADLASEEAELRKARATLSVLRNTSSTLSPVHTLPSEILARIFLMAQSLHSHTSGPSSRAPAHTFAQVCSYWRITAINLPHLWTHVCILHAQTNYEYANLLLRRSKGLPIYLDILTAEVDEWDSSYPSKLQCEAFLTSVCRHVHTLNVKDLLDSPKTFLDETIRLLVVHASPGIMNTLCIQRPDAERTGSLNSLFAGQSDGAVLYYITALHLGDVLIPWTSAIYHNLVDLRLQFRHKPETISTSQLTSILAASPGLTSLKLEHLFIVPSEDRNEKKIVRLAHLEVLYLNHMNKDSLVSLTSIISLSNCLATLEVGIHRCGDGFSEEIEHLAQDFLRDVRIKTLALTSDLHYNDGAQWALSLSKTIPFLENLVLDTLSLYDVRGPGETTDEPETTVGTTSYLPNLFLMAHELDLEKLKLIVSVYGVETLHLRRTWDGSADELKAPLLESCHNLTCVIPDGDPTINWPCRTMFDW